LRLAFAVHEVAGMKKPMPIGQALRAVSSTTLARVGGGEDRPPAPPPPPPPSSPSPYLKYELKNVLISGY
jgi:hypothetical protein